MPEYTWLPLVDGKNDVDVNVTGGSITAVIDPHQTVPVSGIILNTVSTTITGQPIDINIKSTTDTLPVSGVILNRVATDTTIVNTPTVNIGGQPIRVDTGLTSGGTAVPVSGTITNTVKTTIENVPYFQLAGQPIATTTTVTGDIIVSGLKLEGGTFTLLQNAPISGVLTNTLANPANVRIVSTTGSIPVTGVVSIANQPIYVDSELIIDQILPVSGVTTIRGGTGDLVNTDGDGGLRVSLWDQENRVWVTPDSDDGSDFLVGVRAGQPLPVTGVMSIRGQSDPLGFTIITPAGHPLPVSGVILNTVDTHITNTPSVTVVNAIPTHTVIIPSGVTVNAMPSISVSSLPTVVLQQPITTITPSGISINSMPSVVVSSLPNVTLNQPITTITPSGITINSLPSVTIGNTPTVVVGNSIPTHTVIIPSGVTVNSMPSVTIGSMPNVTLNQPITAIIPSGVATTVTNTPNVVVTTMPPVTISGQPILTTTSLVGGTSVQVSGIVSAVTLDGADLIPLGFQHGMATVAVQDVHVVDVLRELQTQLKIMNLHLSLLTDTHIRKEDVDDTD